jgi:hypothetical protein
MLLLFFIRSVDGKLAKYSAKVIRRCQSRRGDQFVPPNQRHRYRRSVRDIDKRPKEIFFYKMTKCRWGSQDDLINDKKRS